MFIPHKLFHFNEIVDRFKNNGDAISTCFIIFYDEGFLLIRAGRIRPTTIEWLIGTDVAMKVLYKYLLRYCVSISRHHLHATHRQHLLLFVLPSFGLCYNYFTYSPLTSIMPRSCSTCVLTKSLQSPEPTSRNQSIASINWVQSAVVLVGLLVRNEKLPNSYHYYQHKY